MSKEEKTMADKPFRVRKDEDLKVRLKQFGSTLPVPKDEKSLQLVIKRLGLRPTKRIVLK